MCPKHCGRRRKLPTRMTIQRGNGAPGALRRSTLEHVSRGSAAGGKDRRQLLRRDDFELRIGAVAGLLVRAPPSKMRHVTEAGSLHVLVSDFDHELGSQRLPRQILALAPAALATGHAMFAFTSCDSPLCPVSPRVRSER